MDRLPDPPDKKAAAYTLRWALDVLAKEKPSVDPEMLNRMGKSGVTARDIYTVGHTAALFQLEHLAKRLEKGEEPS